MESNNIEMATLNGNGESRYVHLFDGNQPTAKTGDDTYRTICGVEYVASRVRIARGEPICQRCVKIENACACVDGPRDHSLD